MTLRAVLWLYDCGISCCEIKLGEHKTECWDPDLGPAYFLGMRDNFPAPQFPHLGHWINGHSPIVGQWTWTKIMYVKVHFKPHGIKQMNDIIFPGITADYFSSLVCTKIFLPALDKVARCFGPNFEIRCQLFFLLILGPLAVCPLWTSPAVQGLGPFREAGRPPRTSSNPTFNPCWLSFYGWRFCFLLNVTDDRENHYFILKLFH